MHLTRNFHTILLNHRKMQVTPITHTYTNCQTRKLNHNRRSTYILYSASHWLWERVWCVCKCMCVCVCCFTTYTTWKRYMQPRDTARHQFCVRRIKCVPKSRHPMCETTKYKDERPATKNCVGNGCAAMVFSVSDMAGANPTAAPTLLGWGRLACVCVCFCVSDGAKCCLCARAGIICNRTRWARWGWHSVMWLCRAERYMRVGEGTTQRHTGGE